MKLLDKPRDIRIVNIKKDEEMRIFKLFRMVYHDKGLKSKDEWIEINLKKEMKYLREYHGELNGTNLREFIKELQGSLKKEGSAETIYGKYKLG